MSNVGSAWAALAAAVFLVASTQGEVTFRLQLTEVPQEISPLVYGVNDWNRGEAGESLNYTLERLGGNRMTGYNWENNYSNAGSDYFHHSDWHLVNSESEENKSKPGWAVSMSVDHAQDAGRPSLVTLQLAGYVAADGNGTVSEADTAPSDRWAEVRLRKEGEYTLTPDTTDGVVYMDEQVNFLIQTYGLSSEGGVFAYSLDNEPALWAHTHSRIHPDAPTVAEIVRVGADCAAMVKDLDAEALIFGPALFGWGSFVDFSAPDWSSYSGEYDWFVSAYLGEMKKQSDAAERRLLDVLDIHFYPEVSVVTGTDEEGADVYTRITDSTSDDEALTQARLQAPRSLWDSNYVEESWITTWSTGGEAVQLLPRVFESIETHYPDTELSISEYDYGGHQNYSGGLAQADVLGIYGRDGVYAACYWGEIEGYVIPAFQLYRNYDGQGSSFGELSVPVENPDAANFSCYASVDVTDQTFHVVAINKTDAAQSTTLDLSQTGLVFDKMDTYGFSEASGPELVAQGSQEGRFEGSVSLDLPARSAMHFVFHSPEQTEDLLEILGSEADGTLRARYRPSVGAIRSLQTSQDLQHWTDEISVIPGDGLVRELELKPEGTSGFWRITESD
ncbi:glycoside hydrolase family 44 protein [Pelagicoccus albus]|uniref:Glycoside hydrolase family 44 protein n=1 Tax=Pelagicoccus albus TaxID=415222 RepID=A0A7X1B8I4_9BACT|nr:glycoside hydrolase family 44 protein [Pelagicoccus albus]